MSYKTALVTFSNSKCYKGQSKLIKSAQDHKLFDHYFTWKYEDYLHTEFYKENLNITSEQRGVGYWVWKPFVILEAMKKINDGDLILYHDSGRPCYDWKFTKSLSPLFDKIKSVHKGLGICFGPFTHGEYCKIDCLLKMNCNTPQFRNHKQLSATWSIWEKNTFCIEILNEWCFWNLHSSRIVTDDASKNTEHKVYDSHRHDQAILTNVILKRVFENKYKPFFAPTGIYEKNINHFVHLPFIFVSIPKNASQSVHKTFGIKLHDHSSPKEMAVCDNHCRGVVLKQRYKDFNRRFKFCIVRNPHERTKSWYVYHKNILKLEPYTKMEFNTWVLAGCPHHWKIQNGTDYVKSGLSPLSQHIFVYENDTLLVDYVCKFETLSDDFSHVCSKINYNLKEILKINASNDDTVKYTTPAFEHVRKLFAKDFELFNY
jgi:hypothetical protein